MDAHPGPTVIMGIDPATRTGWAWQAIGDPMPPCWGAWDYAKIGPTGSTNQAGYRLAAFLDDLTVKIADQHVTLVAYEDAQHGSHNRTVAAFHAEMRGIIRMACATAGVECRAYNPLTIKKFWTNHGKADKVQMMRACETWLHIRVDDPDAADALAVLALAKEELRVEALTGRSGREATPKRMRRTRTLVGGQRGLFGRR